MKKINAIIYTNNFCTILRDAGFTKKGAEKNARTFAQMWIKNDACLTGENLVRIELYRPKGKKILATING